MTLSFFRKVGFGLGQQDEVPGDAFNNTLILTLTEFGRTIKQNGGNGTEHGWGGSYINGGRFNKKISSLY